MNKSMNSAALTLVALFSLLIHAPAAAQDSTAKADKKFFIELSEPRIERQADGSLPEGWDEARFERADGLIYAGQRLTVREFIETAQSEKREAKTLFIKVAAAIPFKRLLGVTQAVKSARLGITAVHWTVTDQLDEAFPVVFSANPFSSISIEDGEIVIGSDTVGEIGEDFEKVLAELKKRREEAMKKQVEVKLTLNDKKKPGAFDWQVGGKKAESKDPLAEMVAAVTAKKKAEGQVVLALAPDHAIHCGDIHKLYAAARRAGAASTEITNFSARSPFSFAFSWNTRDPGWLPRAIDNVLKALAQTQAPQGSWQTARNGDIGRIGATSMAILAFLGEFHTPEDGKYKENVVNGLQYLLSKQQADGSLVDDTSGFSFDHVLGTYALVETYGQTGDEGHEEAAKKALQFLLRCRGKEGAWGKRGPRDPADLVVTAWATMVLKSADDCGLDVPEDSWTGMNTWVASITEKEGGRVKAKQGKKKVTTVVGVADEFYGRHEESLRSLAVLIRTRCKQDEEVDKSLMASVQKVQIAPPDSGSALGLPDLDYLYFGSLVMNAYGSSAWQPWRQGLNSCVESHFKRAGGPGKTEVERMKGADTTELSLLGLCLQLSYRYTQTYEDD